ncbi:NUMOD4 domain-containing protein [Chryseobacterium sp. MYb264]|uniref:NUMOD4 domain-containing protein n=1 Tax=Chryseobacterium sp. MYb264 TaxID=2745153 RepID=UPI002E0ED331|nr:NUMOD4 domain-containing protein [Chryseobacterium sp. MYb264]
MKLPTELGDEYVNTVLSDLSLKDLPNEEWKLIEDFENYAISNYGRVKSLERWVPLPAGGEQKILDRIMKPQFFRYFNKHLKAHLYNVRCNLCIEGRVYGKSVARLVYYHFVEKFDMDDLSFRMSFKDENRFNVHFSNLERLTSGEVRSKALNTGRGKKGNYKQAVSQYTVDGNFVATYESIYAASETLGIHPTYILPVINKKKTTAGKFRWFTKDTMPTKEDFIPETKNKQEKILNTSLWTKLGQPPIDENNPPACMNLSLKDLSGEIWRPFPDLEQYFAISNKGRIKRLNSWTENRNKTFWKEHIISLFVLKSDNKSYYFYTKLTCNGKSYSVVITRMLYYCFVEEFDLKNKDMVIVNKNDPQWDLDISKLTLQSTNDILTERNKLYATKIRTILNSKEVFNNSLWEKLGKPEINKENPPAIFDLSLSDLPDEHWKPLPGFEGKYAISNKGRVKRFSGWGVGNYFYGEEQIISLNLKKTESPSLYFHIHKKEDANPKSLVRLLYYCFVEEFDLRNTTLRVVNENQGLLEIDLSKLLLCPMVTAFKKKK